MKTAKKKMTVQELVKRLNELGEGDPEASHYTADALLLEYINKPSVKEAYDSIRKWYA
jgi:hypothetical protein